MKCFKKLSLVALAAALVSLAGSGSASAHDTVFCAADQTPCAFGFAYVEKARFHAELEAPMTLKAGFVTVECAKGTIEGTTEQTTAQTLGITLSKFEITGCNNGCSVVTLKPGTLDVTFIAKTMNGKLTKTNAQLTINCLGVDCIYGGDVDIGTLTGGANPANGMATIDQTSSTSKVSGGFQCSEPATVNANWTVTSPTPLWVSE